MIIINENLTPEEKKVIKKYGFREWVQRTYKKSYVIGTGKIGSYELEIIIQDENRDHLTFHVRFSINKITSSYNETVNDFLNRYVVNSIHRLYKKKPDVKLSTSEMKLGLNFALQNGYNISIITGQVRRSLPYYKSQLLDDILKSFDEVNLLIKKNLKQIEKI